MDCVRVGWRSLNICKEREGVLSVGHAMEQMMSVEEVIEKRRLFHCRAKEDEEYGDVIYMSYRRSRRESGACFPLFITMFFIKRHRNKI